MEFFKNLFDANPNRTVAFEIKKHCSNNYSTEAERTLSSRYGIKEQQLIWLRNSYNLSAFQAALIAMIEKHPNSYFLLTQSYLGGIIHDVFYSEFSIAMLEELDVPFPSTYGPWSDYFDEYCQRIENHNELTLSATAKFELNQLTSSYQEEVTKFINKRENKLKVSL